VFENVKNAIKIRISASSR